MAHEIELGSGWDCLNNIAPLVIDIKEGAAADTHGRRSEAVQTVACSASRWKSA